MRSLADRMDIECSAAGTINEGLDMVRRGGVDLVFLDLKLPDGDGLSALPEIKSVPDAPEVVILTGKGGPDGAEIAIQGGAWDYLLKPSPVKQTMLIIQRALKYREQKRRDRPVTALDTADMVGRSPQTRKVFDVMARAARSESNVLITGGTGTGKELAARVVHANSARSGGDFVVVDCAAMPANLVESTLFGHRKGSFTGAGEHKAGLVKMADKGTLFLDEIGELPESMQKAFLRVLQAKRFRPVGARSEETSDFRLIAATNRNLESMVEAGEFRSDLYFRLKTVTIEMPPLKDRPEDLKPLVMHWVDRLCEQYGAPNKGFGEGFFEVLRSYDWPGNIRELFHVLERAFVASEHEEALYPMHLPEDIRIKTTKARIKRRLGGDTTARAEDCGGDAASPDVSAVLEQRELPNLKDFKCRMEMRYLRELLERYRGDTASILEVSGLSRSHFYALLKKYGLNS
jgi:two-component system NtrC family response regulator